MGHTSKAVEESGELIPDPVFVQSLRESGVILLTWLACFVWTFTYCTRYGYPTDVDPTAFPTVLGMPSWVVWGIVLPWSLANVVTLVFCFGFMQDAALEPDDMSEQASGVSSSADVGGEL
ncbi:MAG: hypothetical protein NXI04_20005 [Planctomycetaceae bacterium]|nr:hypothetical protein [Planctomycetaceae bacterium]